MNNAEHRRPLKYIKMRRLRFLFFMTLLTVSLAKEEKRKALIISVDESKPEESEAVISDLNLEEQSASPIYRTRESQYSPSVPQPAPFEKQLGYILVTPEDLKRLQNVEGVTVEQPKYLTYPLRSSAENYDPPRQQPSQYPFNSRYPLSPSSQSGEHYGNTRGNKYPERPAPPLPLSTNNNFTDDGSYETPSSPKYSAPTSSHYGSYNSGELSKPNYLQNGVRNIYGGSDYPHPSSPYVASQEALPPYQQPYPAQKEPASYSKPYDYPEGKGPEIYSSSKSSGPSLSAGHKSLPALSYDPKYTSTYDSSTSLYSPKPRSPKFKYYSTLKRPDDYPTTYSSNVPSSKDYPTIYTSDIPSSKEYPSTYTSNIPSSKDYPSTYSSNVPSFKDYPNTYSSNVPPSKNYPNTYLSNVPSSKDYPTTYTSNVRPSKSYNGRPTNSLPDQSISAYRNPKSDSYSQKDTYDIKPDVSHRDITYGTRTKHISDDMPYSKTRLSKPTYETVSGGYTSQERPYTNNNAYNRDYDSESYRSKHPSYDIPDSYHHPVDPKTSYSKAPISSSYEVPNSSHEAYDYPVSSHAGQSPLLPYDSTKYSTKPASTANSETPKYGSSYDSSSDDTYGNRKYPIRYDSPSSVDGKSGKGYGYTTTLSKPHVTHTGSAEDEKPIVTRFYNTPSHSALEPSSYTSKYPKSHYNSNFPKSSYYESSKSSKYPSDTMESPVDTGYHNPALKNDPSISKSPLYDSSHAHDASSEIRDHHSVAKNYKPSRPAPLYDEYDQPRYPPLPGDTKDSSEKFIDYKKYENKPVSNEENIGKTSYEVSQPSIYSSAPHKYSYSNDKSKTYYPISHESAEGHYSNHPSQEVDDEPQVYTKTVTKTYTKPYKESSGESSYYGDHSSEGPYNQPSSNNSPSSAYSPPNDKTYSYSSNPSSYSKPYAYSEPTGSSDEYSYSKPLDNGEKKFKYYTQNDKPDSSYTYIAESHQPKRVEGVVYRSRKTYPDLQSPRRQKSYLPYKLYNPKTAPALDYKVYENAPEKNFTKSPRKNSIKLKYKPVKKDSYQENIKETSAYDNSYEDTGFSNIPGEPGKDFPTLKAIPYTHFSCENRVPGFYADIEHRCQVYYQCSDKGRIQSFLCPNGTIFNQETFVCEWWHNVDCAKSEKHFAKNNDLYKPNIPESDEQNDRDKYSPSVRSQGHAFHEYPPSEEYADTYRQKDDTRHNNYSKAPRNRRRNRSKVTYSSSHD